MCSGNEAYYSVLFLWNHEAPIVDVRMSVALAGAVHYTVMALCLLRTSGNTFTSPAWKLEMF